jgi:hypothetical protein
MWWWNDDMEGEKEKEAQTEFFQAHTHTSTCGRAHNGNLQVEQPKCPFTKTPK